MQKLKLCPSEHMSRVAWLAAAVLLAFATPSRAGLPLICRGYDIGTARSLPWLTDRGWAGQSRDYDTARLVADTVALLTPSTPVIVRMETLRRAALYADGDPSVAGQLLQRLIDRSRAPETQNDPLAAFDAGYLIETYRQLARMSHAHAPELRGLVVELDGYSMIRKSATLRPGDPAIEFAAAVVAYVRDAEGYPRHSRNARSAASRDQLVARNIDMLPQSSER